MCSKVYKQSRSMNGGASIFDCIEPKLMEQNFSITLSCPYQLLDRKLGEYVKENISNGWVPCTDILIERFTDCNLFDVKYRARFIGEKAKKTIVSYKRVEHMKG